MRVRRSHFGDIGLGDRVGLRRHDTRDHTSPHRRFDLDGGLDGGLGDHDRADEDPTHDGGTGKDPTHDGGTGDDDTTADGLGDP